MKVELPRENKSLADINAGECFAVIRGQVASICMKVAWLSADLIAVLWSDSEDWTVPQLIAPTELAGSSLSSLPNAIFVVSSDAKHIRAGATRHEHAPGFLIKTPDGTILIAVKGLQLEHGRPVIDVETGKASWIESDKLTFFTSWRIATKMADKYETVCSFPSNNQNQESTARPPILVANKNVASGIERTELPVSTPLATDIKTNPPQRATSSACGSRH
jgi:hypothetical protein